jgi:hypothetical protein
MSRPKNGYIIRYTQLTRGVITYELVMGRAHAMGKARDLSLNGRETTVRRQCDGALMAAFHSGGHYPLSEIQLNDFATWDADRDPWHHLYNPQRKQPTP